MNRKFEELNRGIAVQVVAQKFADGRIDPLASFEELVTEFQDGVLKLAEGFGEKDKEAPPKPKRAPRKAAEPSSTGKRSGIDAGALEALLGLRTQSDGMSLQDLANHFSVSKGVAERAVKALPGVKFGPGAKAAGQRGKPPTVFWVE